MQLRLAVVSIRAENVPVCTHFYRDVLGLPLLAHDAGTQPHFDLPALGPQAQVDGVFLTIVQGRPCLPSEDEPRFPLVAFAVPDLDSAVARLEQHAVELPWGLESNPGACWLMFHDPAGNLLELVEFTSPH